VIRIRNARIHNLKHIDVDIPKGKLTVITGVSGSGKSSLAFDTIYEEGKRRYLQYVGSLLQIDEHQPFDEITGLSPTLAVEQRSTLGTRTKINNLLQMLFSVAGVFPCPDCGGKVGEPRICAGCGTVHEPYSSSFYSRNSAIGFCFGCLGTGYRAEIGADEVYKDPGKPIGKMLVVTPNIFRHLITQMPDFYRAYGLKETDPCGSLSQAAREAFLYGSEKTTFEGIIPYVRRNGMVKPMASKIPLIVRAGMGCVITCPECGGTGLGEVARHTTIGGRHIGELGELAVKDLQNNLETCLEEGYIDRKYISLVNAIHSQLAHLIDVGLGYLSLSRATPTISGGELQRMFLASYLISSLDSVIFVFDEPTIGMHEVEKGLLLRKLGELVQGGNTVIVVEHDPGIIAAANYVVDLGPGAGAQGGSLIYSGDYPGFLQCQPSASAAYLTGKRSMPARRGRLDNALRRSGEMLILHNACTHNLKDITVEIPLGVLVGIAGVSGSGKSSLVADTLVPALNARMGASGEDEEDGETFFSSYQVGRIEGIQRISRCAVISQKPIGRMSTSTPASYTGIYDRIRQIFAAQPLAIERGYCPGHFTLNAEGGCQKCGGKGKIYTYVGYGNVITRACEACGGSGFEPEVLDVRFQGRTICDVLNMTVTEAMEMFAGERKITSMLSVLERIGMGYITLGQPATTVSGGEAQRIKLAKELGKRSSQNVLYILDEPTTGLSLADTARLMEVLDELVEHGNSVLFTEHDPTMLAFCDWLIELGPGGGNEGGWVIAAGTPGALIANPVSVIGRYLQRGK